MKATISKEYKSLLTEQHAKNEKWGTSARKHAEPVKELMLKHELYTLLDYGCGKGELLKSFDQKALEGCSTSMIEYDPAIPNKNKMPKGKYDLVACIDVLEHVEPELLDNVLADLKRLTKKLGYLVISTRPASCILADGRNAHLIIERPVWWKKKIAEHFENFDSSFNSSREELTVIVSADKYKAEIEAPEAPKVIKPKGLWM